MKKVIATGVQDFERLIVKDSFYIDKTEFIRDWWNSQDAVTLITRPRRFGKTLNMSMMNCFFSTTYSGRKDLFEGLSVWNEEGIRKEQGNWPVISLTFAGIKGTTFESTIEQIKALVVKTFSKYPELYCFEELNRNEKASLEKISEEMNDTDAALSLNLLSRLLEKFYGRKVLIFLDEYDTPLQEAYINGFWKELVAFIRTMFNNTFKTNESLERALLTGITRVSKESIFSDLNNLTVVTTTSEKYATAFGFTEQEVFRALEEQGYSLRDQQDVKAWYDGFTFGKVSDIYNPWSVTNFMDQGKLDTYWGNSSGNGLVSHLLRRSKAKIKMQFETLLQGETIQVPVDEQIVFEQLDRRENAIWSLLLASGYLKVENVNHAMETGQANRNVYTLSLTNREVLLLFNDMVEGWFEEGEYFGEFVTAMLAGNELDMNRYMNRVAMKTFSSFDTARTKKEPERFYHGFVLGLLVDQRENYNLKSNRESGYGRYDVVMEPKRRSDVGVILEFKVFAPEEGDQTLEDTARKALNQIEEKKYDTELRTKGVTNILKYGLAFRGKDCLILRG